jgi:hypothetical protein
VSDRLHRLAAIVHADFLIRIRRPSTVVLFLLISASAYLWIPDPATGRTIMQMGGQRVLYNSAAIGMATACLGTLVIGLVSFYVVSNALRRDVQTRCGFVIASTTVRGSEYVAGKFAGNAVFLAVFSAGFMLTSMVMVLVRGEAPLQPAVFLWQYAVILTPAIVFVSAVAILFECTPLLRTRGGDVFYFFLWLSLMGAVASTIENSTSASWLAYFDISGIGLVLQEMRQRYDTESLSIGASTFDPSKTVVVFEGIRFTGTQLALRLAASAWPLVLLIPARFFFHRFDPARLKAIRRRGERSWLATFNRAAAPLARPFRSIGSVVAAVPRLPAVVRASVIDAFATFSAFPLAVAAMIGFSVAALTAPEEGLRTGVLPFATAAAAIPIADVASRERRAGTTAMVYAAPGLRTGFVMWKMLAATMVLLLFLAVPLARAIRIQPSGTMALLTATLFIAACATSLGVVTSNPKAFLVVFLTFWYVAVSDKGASPAMNFAGWFGPVPAGVTMSYVVMAAAALALAQWFHARRLSGE